MLGRLHPTAREATVIGAGFAGLLAAYQLLQQGYQVTVFDAAPRPGGLIATQQTPYGPVEQAAHSVRSNAEFEQLCQQLHVPLVTAKTKKKFIWRGGLRSWPLNVLETVALLWRVVTQKAVANETLADWGTRHLGPAAVDHILTPLAAGIYGTTPDRLLAGLALPRLNIPVGKTLLQHALNGFGLPKPKTRMCAPARGMQQLIDALAHAVHSHPNGTLKLNSRLTILPDTPNLLIATGATAAAALLDDTDGALASALRTINYVPLIAATVFVKRSDHRAIQGVGTLYSKQAPLHGLGVLFNSLTFDGRATKDVDSFTIMLGGRKNPDLLQADDASLHGHIISDLEKVIGLSAPPLHITITRWPHAIPEYGPAVADLLTGEFNWLHQPGHLLLGNYTGEVSLRGMAAQNPTTDPVAKAV